MQRFPFLSHRTMAQVCETEALMLLREAGKLNGSESRHLYALLCRADINNPPPVEPEDAA